MEERAAKFTGIALVVLLNIGALAVTSSVADGRSASGLNNHEDCVWASNETTYGIEGRFAATPGSTINAAAGNLPNAFVAPTSTMHDIPPSFTSFLPADIDVILGYTPSYISAHLVQGVPATEAGGTSMRLDSVPIISILSADNELRANISMVLSDGPHVASAGALWMGQWIYQNWTFYVNHSSPLAIRPSLSPISPAPNGGYAAWPTEVRAHIQMLTTYGMIRISATVRVDGIIFAATVNADSLVAHIGWTDYPLYGSHSLTATLNWDNERGETSVNWSFVVRIEPAISPFYPAPESSLYVVPDHIEVSVFPGYPESPASVGCYLDGIAIPTSMISNVTARAVIIDPLLQGWHSVSASLHWNGTDKRVSWRFFIEGNASVNVTLARTHNTEGEFSMLLPVAWTIQTNQSISGQIFQLAAYGPIVGGFKTNLLVQASIDPSVQESTSYLDEQVNSTVDTLREQGVNVTLYEHPTFGKVGNFSCVVFSLRWRSTELVQKMAMIVSEDLGGYWILTFSIHPSVYAQYNATFNTMIDSFDVTSVPDGGTTSVPSLSWVLVALLIGVITAAVVAVVLFLDGRKKPAPRPMTYQPAPLQYTPIIGVCPRCGRSNAADAAFCSNCGLTLSRPPK